MCQCFKRSDVSICQSVEVSNALRCQSVHVSNLFPHVLKVNVLMFQMFSRVNLSKSFKIINVSMCQCFKCVKCFNVNLSIISKCQCFKWSNVKLLICQDWVNLSIF